MKNKNLIDRTILLFEYTNYLKEAGEEQDNLNLTPPQEDELGNENIGDEGIEEEMPQEPQVETPLQDADTEEIDITELVEKQNSLIAQFSELQNAVKTIADSTGAMQKNLSTELDSIKNYFSKEFGGKVEELRKEVIVRNPTPKEELGLRSLSSYPYNVKVSDYFQDYFKEKEEAKEQLASPQSVQLPKETTPQQDQYVLTKNLMSKISDVDVRNSF